MSAQNNLEQILKEIHIMVSECPKLKGDPDKIVMDKNVLFAKLNDVSQCLYDMLDEYELTKQKKKEAQYQMKHQYEEAIENASSKAEDVYSASVLYTDEAITRLVRLIESNEKSVEQLYSDLQKKLQRECNNIRTNQKELQDLLFDMRDSNLYINLLNDRRRQMEQEKDRVKTGKTVTHASTTAYPKADIKINKQYFEQMGLNEDGTPKPKVEEKKEAPEIKVDMNSNYFKWKKSQATAGTKEPTNENNQ